MHEFRHETILDCSQQTLWDFLTRPRNLVKLSPEELQLKIDEATEQVALDSEFRFSITVMGAIVRSRHKITVWEPMTRFVENQEEGPFQTWRQEHVFESIDAKRTRMIDRIEFKPPGGLVGMLLTEGRVREQLENGMAFREEAFRVLIERGELA